MIHASQRAASWLCGACLSALILPLSTTSYALPGEVGLSQLYQKQWRVQDGAPAGIAVIVQTRDGFIWMLASGRLFRFDGVEFEPIEQIGTTPLPSDRIFEIWARPSGGLWISYLFGGATFIGDGIARNYAVSDGLPADMVYSFAEDATGRMWAGTAQGLLWLEGGRWRPAEDAWEFPKIHVLMMNLDRDGTLWVLTRDRLHYQRRGSRRFESGIQADGQFWAAMLIGSPDGRTWLTRAGFGLTELRLPTPGEPMVPAWRLEGFESKNVLPLALIDRDENLWLSAWGSITRRSLRHSTSEAAGDSGAAGTTLEQARLTGEQSGPMLEDFEGNIWAASSGGLDKFRTSAFIKARLERASYGSAALAATDDGSVWISTLTHTLHRFKNGVEQESMESPHSPHDVLYRDHTGTLWVGGMESSIHHRRGNEWVEWHPDDVVDPGGVQAIVSQPDGTMWVSILRVGVYRVVENQWTLWGGLAGLPREAPMSLAVDPAGRLWLGYLNSRIAVVDQGRVMVFDATDGLTTGTVQVMAVRGRNIWIGGEKALNYFDGQRFHTVAGVGGHTFLNVNGIVERVQGELWLNTAKGAVLIPASETRTVAVKPDHPVTFKLFDYLDGMMGASPQNLPWPTAVESGDGRIWFSTMDGVVSLSPHPPASNPIVPSAYVKSITVDGTQINVESKRSSTLQLPSNPGVLQIAYTAPSFAIPERVHFRYRLEGSKMGWEDVGTRREAYFTGLAPGSYRFQVTAANDSGLWNDTVTSLEFVIPPTFLQSRTFLLICVAVSSAALWLLFALRLRQVKAQLLSHSEERLMERERIARDLHDTFLQGVQGLMLRFQSATERIPEDAPARKLMEDALDRADRVLTEGRDKVSELRTLVSLNLHEALKMVGNELSRDYAASFHAQTEGAKRELNPLVQEEAFRIGAEALTNAFRHARATHINATVLFARSRLELRVVDDGSGFDMSDVKPGRWGLKGIRERAERIRGKVIVTSQPGQGTTVELRIPAKLAYQKAGGTRWNWRNLVGAANIEERT